MGKMCKPVWICLADLLFSDFIPPLEATPPLDDVAAGMVEMLELIC